LQCRRWPVTFFCDIISRLIGVRACKPALHIPPQNLQSGVNPSTSLGTSLQGFLRALTTVCGRPPPAGRCGRAMCMTARGGCWGTIWRRATAAGTRGEYIYINPDAANDNASPYGGDDGMGGYGLLAIATKDAANATAIHYIHSNHLGVPILTLNSAGGLHSHLHKASSRAFSSG
jgi:hypothetical protein